MIRMTLGTVIGIAVAFVTVLVMQKIGHVVFPPPGDLDADNTESIRTYVDSMPVGAFAFVLASYIVGTFDGVFIACLIARMKYHVYGIIIGGLMLFATIANLILIPHPNWFSASAVAGIALAAAMASWLSMRTLPEVEKP